MAAELTLDAAHSAVHHVLGAPGIASFTAACLTADRAVDLGRLERLIAKDGEPRHRLLFEVAAELYGREQGVSLSELLAELDGEDLDRVLYAMAVLKGRRSTSSGWPDDLWIRASEPEKQHERSRSVCDRDRGSALPRLAVRVLRVARAGCFDADDIPEVHRNPLRCARAALAQDDRHADPAEQT